MSNPPAGAGGVSQPPAGAGRVSLAAAGIDPAVQQGLAGLLGVMGAADFARAALAALQPAVQAASWSVYALRADAPPVLHLSGTAQGPDLTRACFEAYAAGGLYLRDSSFDAVRRAAAPGQPVVTTMAADAAPNPDHREAIYRAHRLRERLSVAALQPDGSLLAVNLYHHEPQGPFTEAERARFQALAPLLHCAVQRQLVLVPAQPPLPPQHQPPQPAPQPAEPATPPEAAHRAALLAAAPTLTPRELEVCLCLLRGWTHDGVAADLGLSPATVKTYRARAFLRLGIHFRSELFARFGVASLRAGS